MKVLISICIMNSAYSFSSFNFRHPSLIIEMVEHITKLDGLLEKAIQDDDMVK